MRFPTEALLSPDESHLPRHRTARWLPWLFGAAAFVAVIMAALHVTEAQDFLRIARQAAPWWLVVALGLQASTYLATGQVFRLVARAGRHRLGLLAACRLSLAKLFVDQALPSAGVSGTIVLASGLGRRGLPRPVVAAAIAVDEASYHMTYVVSLAAALAILAAQGGVHPLVLAVSVPFFVVALVISWLVLSLAGRPRRAISPWLARFGALRSALEFLEDADPRLARRPGLLLEACFYHLLVMLADAATVWVLIRALGADPPAGGVFASFMISSLLRTVGFVPGGLGTFEATAVVTLHVVGVPTAVALAATLLFRGLSFWLPMLPGLWFSRGETRRQAEASTPTAEAYWDRTPDELYARLDSRARGLTSAEAARRLRVGGKNLLQKEDHTSRLRVLGKQVASPLLLLLLFAAAVSAATGEWTDAAMVGAIVLTSIGIGYRREYSAETAIAALRARTRTHTRVLRDDAAVTIGVEDVVPGDVLLLAAGSIVPADGLVLEATDCHVSEAVLTGESMPVEKAPGRVPVATPLARRGNCVFLGTNVRSGTARCLVVATGRATEFGGIAHRLTLRPPETGFDRGVRHFGYLLTTAMLIMVLLVFGVHVVGGRPPIETLLFAIALAVGLSPELLPFIVTVNLARSARQMAERGVLVRRLNAIENLGSMDVLCTDKTGTLTEGVVRLEGAYDAEGARSPAVLELGALNAQLETGLPSPLDDAILADHAPDLTRVVKRAEIPFDFVRKRVSVIVEDADGVRLVAKGAFQHVLEACSSLPDGRLLDAEQHAALEARYAAWSAQGVRVLAVATRAMPAQESYRREDEHDLVFAGFLTFLDRPKEGVREAIAALGGLGVAVKVITGDSGLVARHVAGLVGLSAERVLSGKDLDELNDEALWHAAERTDLFVEVDPNQKERILLALKKTGHVVGFLGDGVNDAPAMHAADTSLSVDQAVDVARAAADFVLLERNLDVIRRGIEEGRKTFANTLKYVLTTTSANLGNMASMAVASLFLPFLPLTAGQIILNNFISDIPAVGLANDSVDPELVARPRRWDMRFIGRFMVQFGALSSLFDLVTFAALLGLFHATPELFRTGWFVESLLTELVVALVVRTRRPLRRSRPGRLLLWSTLTLVPVAFAIPYLPYAHVMGFVPMPATLVAALAGITVAYVLAVELMKRWFYRRPE